MTAKQILWNVNKMLKPSTLSSNSYRCKSYNIEQQYDLDERTKRNDKRGTCHIDDQNLLKRKPTDLLLDPEMGHVGPKREQNTDSTSRLDTS